MKKIIILASALVLGGTAYAQDASMQPPSSGSTMPSTPDSSMPAATTPDASAPAGSMPGGSMPSNSMPAGATDSSMPAAAPAAAPDASGGQTASATDDSNLPTCSKSVTDKCKQGAGGSMHHKKAMHHKKK